MTFTQWSRCRRDLLVGFVASALTVTILVPLGWVLLRQEQQQAAAQDVTSSASDTEGSVGSKRSNLSRPKGLPATLQQEDTPDGSSGVE